MRVVACSERHGLPVHLPTWRGSSTTSGREQNLVQCMVTGPHRSSRIMPCPWWLSTSARAFIDSAAGQRGAGADAWA